MVGFPGIFRPEKTTCTDLRARRPRSVAVISARRPPGTPKYRSPAANMEAGGESGRSPRSWAPAISTASMLLTTFSTSAPLGLACWFRNWPPLFSTPPYGAQCSSRV